MDEFLKLEPLTKGYLSFSQITTWLKCRLRFYYQYVNGWPGKVGGALVIGSAYHRALAYGFKQKAMGGDWDAGDVQDVCASEFDAISRDAGPLMDWGEDDPGEEKDVGVSLARAYSETVAPMVPVSNAANVERRLELTVGDTKMVGYVDLLTADQTVVDHKTTGKKMNADAPASSLQLEIYATALDDLGEPVKTVAYHAAVKNKTPVIQVLEAPARVDRGRLDRMVKGTALDMRTGNFYPSGYGSGWGGGCTMCPYSRKDAGEYTCEMWK